MFNSVQIIGNLGANPETRHFESGSVVTKFTLYVNERSGKGDQAQERTHRFQIETWGKTAEYANNYLRKGSRVAIQGTLAEDTWQDRDSGDNRSRIVIRANRVENLTPKKANQTDDNYGSDEEF